MTKNRIDRRRNQDVQFGNNPVQTKVENTNAACEPEASSIELILKQPGPPTAPTHEQIAERAKMIWQQRGCIPGEDEQNWYEAETQLKAEMHID
jgi:hypothetical protein